MRPFLFADPFFVDGDIREDETFQGAYGNAADRHAAREGRGHFFFKEVFRFYR